MRPMRFKLFSLSTPLRALSVLGMLSCWSLLAQTHNDPVYLNLGYYSPATLKNTELKSPLRYLDAALVLPEWKWSDKTRIYLQLSYKLYSYDFTSTWLDKQNLTDARAGFILRHNFSEQYELLFLPRLHLRTNFADHWQKRSFFPSFSGILLRHAPKISQLTYGLGLSLNNDLNRNSILPLAFLSYQTDRFRVNAIIPVYVYVTWMAMDKKLEYGWATVFDAQILYAPIETGTYLKTRNILLGPAVSYAVTPKGWINVKSGWSAFRNFEVLDDRFQTLSHYENQKLSTAFFVTLGWSWRLGN